MSKFFDWMVRTVVCSSLEDVRDRSAGYDKADSRGPGELTVKLSTGGEVKLAFPEMIRLDATKVAGLDELLLAAQAGWPDELKGCSVRPFADGLTLCDISAVLRSETHALALLQYGQLRGELEVVYDPAISCPHDDHRECQAYCTLMVTKFNVPPRRPRKKKEKEKAAQKVPWAEKFRLPDLFPERGIALT